ncbi:hypothetical protein CWI42_020300 [Ordospora colligata]|uniref:Uncharacterized protein n=1 Tax=Ordospora colligata OC4 TaxID=1354746 RepID=A0A0B2UMC4_9MICR|nr:uncharacterized protein M896_020310 [Ordospora colligata OC4]KHN70197.1 hypothetical protein M896_020310 [Ordospora colligata OC4]TBU16741.1 hypothetical protein CWI41_020320 [Ordospora colligata]TBU17047.1 hypothetical protein CWI40_020320 [Ordospora colligata]TBU19471.1 hypothetical protein CWI42_020300 [Ordospora colligata]
MDKIHLFAAKTLLTSAFAVAVFVHNYSFKLDINVALALAVGFNLIVLLRFHAKVREYRRRFLRKTYEPDKKMILGLFVCEVLSMLPFYYITAYWKVMLINIACVEVMNILLIFKSPSRRTFQLEHNKKEFFKIGFLKTEYCESGDICLNRGEVVQILDRNGDKSSVRKSDGRIFIIDSVHIDDGIEIVL